MSASLLNQVNAAKRVARQRYQYAIAHRSMATAALQAEARAAALVASVADGPRDAAARWEEAI